MKFTCTQCADEHDVLDVSFGANEPYAWLELPGDKRKDSLLSSDQCVIAHPPTDRFFVRSCLDLPIEGQDRAFSWGVWVELEEGHFAEIHDHWNDPKRVHLAPHPALLATSLPGYATTTLGLAAHLQQREVGQRPLVVLVPAEHQIVQQQQNGAALPWLEALVAKLLHPEATAD